MKLNCLKINLRSKCNFHCIFCKLPQEDSPISKESLLSRDEMVKLVDGFYHLGIEHVKITGPEPLLREDLFDFVHMISRTNKFKQISLTTNGYFLKDKAMALKGAGVNRVSIFLDSLDEDRFKKITGVDGLSKVMDGICAAKEAELLPIRINVVLVKGLNEDEIEDFAALTTLYPLDVRFIEYLPNSKYSSYFKDYYVSGHSAKNDVESVFGALMPDKSNPLEGPANYYRIKDAKGRVGFINPVTEFFCFKCNSIMLTEEGKVFPCLNSNSSIDLKEYMDQRNFKELSDKLKECIEIKPHINKEAKT